MHGSVHGMVHGVDADPDLRQPPSLIQAVYTCIFPTPTKHQHPPLAPYHAPTHAPTQAGPSLPVNRNPNPTPPNRGAFRLHDTAAVY